jgi:S-adenosylmethionine:tRNA ribosyltransferase-isomerase
MRAVEFGFFTWNAKSFDGWTNKFVFPPHEFDSYLHDYKLSYAKIYFINDGICILGHDLMKRAYEEAIKEEYKFYSYGDAMLII